MFWKFCVFYLILAYQSVKCQNLKQLIRENPSIFIVNGKPTPSGSFPFIVSLGIMNKTSYRHRCGANIITQNYILTAAHCVQDIGNNYDPQFFQRQTGSSLVVIAGIDSLNPSEANPQTEIYLIQKISYNTNYRSITDPFDIAVLRTSKVIRFNSRVRPVKLPSSSNPAVVYGRRMTVIGWGVTEQGVLSTRLRMTDMTSINFMGLQGECNGLDSKFYCMKDLTSVQSNACFGDSGGPLVRIENNQWVLYGLTSFGQSNNQGKCINSLPGFFTMVPSLLSWISQQTRSSFVANKQTLSFV